MVSKSYEGMEKPKGACKGSAVLEGDHSLNRRSGNLLHDDN
jgi:hypothetical protein